MHLVLLGKLAEYKFSCGSNFGNDLGMTIDWGGDYRNISKVRPPALPILFETKKMLCEASFEIDLMAGHHQRG
jgi:hypothetical protein